MMSITGAGPMAAPRRNPVIAYFLPKVYRITVRSCISGHDASERLRPL